MSDTWSLKYRPKDFSDVIGNENIAKIFKGMVAQDKLPTALFLSGTRGSGKTSSARVIAKAVNCLNRSEDGEPCCECENCKAITDGKFQDVIELDAASENSVQAIRELIKSVSYLPSSAKKKIYIIDECHSLSAQASNALLKTLEEPPSFVMFIFCTTEPQKVLNTIRSRCLQFSFKDIREKDITKRLRFIAEREGLHIDEMALSFIARTANGGMRDAVMLLEQSSFVKGKDELIKSSDIMDIVGAISIKDLQRFFQILKEGTPKELLDWLDEARFSPQDILVSSINFIDTLVLIKEGVSPSEFVSKDQVAGIMGLSSILSFQEAVLLFKEFKGIIYDLKQLSLVNTTTLFRLRMLDVYTSLRSGPIQTGQSLGVPVQPMRTFLQMVKAEYNVTRVPTY